MCIRLIASMVLLVCIGYESGKRGFLVNATVFINGMKLNEFGYSGKSLLTFGN